MYSGCWRARGPGAVIVAGPPCPDDAWLIAVSLICTVARSDGGQAYRDRYKRYGIITATVHSCTQWARVLHVSPETWALFYTANGQRTRANHPTPIPIPIPIPSPIPIRNKHNVFQYATYTCANTVQWTNLSFKDDGMLALPLTGCPRSYYHRINQLTRSSQRAHSFTQVFFHWSFPQK